ncbi:MAG: hypothetical protein JXP34_22265 [Planctomycetes bacterium]|nr:hypothetical protein [Planctomycetota bacterium]
MTRRTFVISLLVGCLAIGSPGCSLFVPHTQLVRVTASEPDADILINGNLVGQGRAQASVPRNRDATVTAEKPGFRPAQRHIPSHLNAAGCLDILGGLLFLIPFIGLFSPGAHSLEQTDVYLTLPRAQSAEPSEAEKPGSRERDAEGR